MALLQWNEIETKFKNTIEAQNILLSLEKYSVETIFSQLQTTQYLQLPYLDILSRKIISCVRSRPQNLIKYAELAKLINKYFLEKESNINFLNQIVSIISFSSNCKIIDGYNELLKHFENILLEKCEYIDDSIISIFRLDDVKMLQKLNESPTFDINFLYHFENPLFFPGSIHTSLIHLSAYFGALKCFKYLLINGASLEIMDDIYGTTWFTIEDAAIFGGSIEIIKLLTQQNHNEFALSTAALAHRNQIFYWIYEHKYQQKLSLSSLYCSSIANNLELIIFCIKNGDDINSITENPLIAAVEYGNYEVVQLLFCRNRLDINIQNQNHENSYLIAKKHNDKEMCKLILSHPKFRR